MRKILFTLFFVIFSFFEISSPGVEREMILKKQEKASMAEIVFSVSGVQVPKGTNEDHLSLMYKLAKENGIPLDIMFWLVHTESRFKPDAVSPVGAYGYMQVMPETYKLYLKRLEIEDDGHTPETNILIGVKLLSDLHWRWLRTQNEKKAWELALASYNAGIANVIKYGGIPPFPETQNYVWVIKNGRKSGEEALINYAMK